VKHSFDREQLERPPLVEATFEIRVASETPYALVPGGLYAQLREDFPEVEEILPPGLADADVPPPLAFHRFTSRDERRLVQCGPNLLSVNVLGDYGAFESFEKFIQRALSIYEGIVKPSRVERLGIRYINFVDEEVLQGTWPFDVQVHAPKGNDLPLRETYAKLVLADRDASLGVVVAYPAVLPNQRRGALLDLDYFQEKPPIKTAGDCVAWARHGHEQIYQAFRHALSAPVYEIIKARK
jgi:uncharacterized protein (TIGR04255 family)